MTNESDNSKEVADLCVEFWKLMTSATKAASLLPEAEGKRLAAQVKFSQRQLERLSHEIGLRLIDPSGEPFHAGIAASADNADDFEDETPLVVTKTLEPAVVRQMRVVRAGRVLVGPIQSSEE